MNTDDDSKLTNANLSHEIIGRAFEVINELGHGLHEKPYENSLVVEFALKKILHTQQQEFPVLYKEVEVGKFIPDLIVYNAIVVDTKVIERNRSGAGPNAQLSQDNRSHSRPHHKLQTSKIRMGTHCSLI